MYDSFVAERTNHVFYKRRGIKNKHMNEHTVTRVLTDWNTARTHAKSIARYHTETDYTYTDLTTDWSAIKDIPAKHVLELVYAVTESELATHEAIDTDDFSSTLLSQWLHDTPDPSIPNELIKEISTHAAKAVDNTAPLQNALTRWVQSQKFELHDTAALAGWAEAQKLASVTIDTYKTENAPYNSLEKKWPSGVALPPRYAFEYYIDSTATNTEVDRNDIATLISTYTNTNELPDEIDDLTTNIDQPSDVTVDDETWETAVTIADDIAEEFYDGGEFFDTSNYDVELPSRVGIAEEARTNTSDTRQDWVTNMASTVSDWITGEVPTYGSPYNPQRKSQPKH